jgi:hypothetical protein
MLFWLTTFNLDSIGKIHAIFLSELIVADLHIREIRGVRFSLHYDHISSEISGKFIEVISSALAISISAKSSKYSGMSGAMNKFS